MVEVCRISEVRNAPMLEQPHWEPRFEWPEKNARSFPNGRCRFQFGACASGAFLSYALS